MSYGRDKLQILTVVKWILVVWSNFTLKDKNPEDKYNSLVNNLDLFRPRLVLNNRIFRGPAFYGVGKNAQDKCLQAVAGYTEQLLHLQAGRLSHSRLGGKTRVEVELGERSTTISCWVHWVRRGVWKVSLLTLSAEPSLWEAARGKVNCENV